MTNGENPLKKLLLVVDYQNDFVCGSLGFPQAELLDGKIAARISECRDKNFDIAFTLDTHDDNYSSTAESDSVKIKHCIANTVGHKLFGVCHSMVKEIDKVFLKNSFTSEEIFSYLAQAKYDYIELVGLVTNICILSNAIVSRCACPNADVVVNSGLVDSYDKDLHKKTLAILPSLAVKVI